MDRYIQAQRENGEAGRKTPYFRELIGSVDAAYRAAFKLSPIEVSPMFGKLLLICHKSLLSAAALIAQCQPDDSVGITRRAVEVAKTALAIKLNPKNAEHWVSFQQRHERWLRRQEGEKPKFFTVQFEGTQADPLVQALDTFLGIVSDAYVHFTPEYYSSLDWEVFRTSETGGEIRLNYFHRNPREVERHYIALTAFHGKILQVFDSCFDGFLSREESTRKQMEAIWIVSKKFSDEYHRRYNEPTGLEGTGVL